MTLPPGILRLIEALAQAEVEAYMTGQAPPSMGSADQRPNPPATDSMPEAAEADPSRLPPRPPQVSTGGDPPLDLALAVRERAAAPFQREPPNGYGLPFTAHGLRSG